MNIDKSQIIGKSVKDIPKDILLTIHEDSKEYHPVWKTAPKRYIDFLSRCILRYNNSYGATYQISQNKELAIISNKGQSYTLESYTKLVDLIIVDYQDSSEDKPMKTIKQSSYQAGDKVKIRENLSNYYNTNRVMCKLAGTIVTITKTTGDDYGYAFEGSSPYHWSADMFEGLVVEESPQPTIADIKVGTHWERLENFNDYPKGEIITVTKVTESSVSYCKGRGKNIQVFIKSFKPRPDLDNTSIDEPVKKHTTNTKIQTNILTVGDAVKPIDNIKIGSLYNYLAFHEEHSFSRLTVIEILSPTTVRLSNGRFYGVNALQLVESNTVAQPEPTKPTKSENTFMSKIKQTALITVDQNKQATIIASKMEAGRILNKQIIKQAKPHVPMFFRGYLDTPLAPVILANLVALAGNHTDNKRIKQISELMLLAAADTTIQSFNLDQIIDDVLKNIKLPAGILDDNDE